MSMWKRRPKKPKRKPDTKVVIDKKNEENGFLEQLERRSIRWKKIIAYYLMFLTLVAAAVRGSADILIDLARYIVVRWQSLWP